MLNNKEMKLLERKFYRQQKIYFFPLANAYRERNNLDKCISLFRQGICVFPQYWAARVALGRALMERGDLDEALEELEAAVDQVPENFLLHRLLALIYFKKGKLLKSATYCRLVLFMVPDDRECLFIMDEISKIQARGSQTEAIIEETKRFSPERAQQKQTQKEQTQQAGRAQKEQAPQTEQVKKTKKKKEQEEQAQGEIVTPTIAELYLSQGFAEKALEIYQKLLIRQPDRTEWRERIHSIQKESGIEICGSKANDLGGERPGVEGSGGEHHEDPAEILRQLDAWLEHIENSEKSKVK
jgi:tetratricopeptide (TPR) repeat protein